MSGIPLECVDSLTMFLLDQCRATLVGVVRVESRVEGYITQMMGTTLPCAYTWLGLTINSHLAETIILPLSCLGILLFISATCFSRALWCSVQFEEITCWLCGAPLHIYQGLAPSLGGGAPQEADAGVCGDISEQWLAVTCGHICSNPP